MNTETGLIDPPAQVKSSAEVSSAQRGITTSSSPRAVGFLLVIAVGVSLTLLLNFPGVMSNDAVYQLWQARGHSYTDWHPPMMAFAWHYLDLVIPGPLPMLLLQALFWWGGLSLIAGVTLRTRFAPVLVLLTGLWPTTFANIGAISKDMQMATSLVFAVGVVLRAWRTQNAFLPLAAYVLMFYANGVRHNGMVAAAPILLWTVCLHYRMLRSRGARSRGLIAALSVLFLFIIMMPGYVNRKLTDKDGRTRIQQVLYLYDLAAISCRSGKQVVPDWALAAPDAINDLCTSYTSITGDPMIFASPPLFIQNPKKSYVEKLKAEWHSAVLSHPRVYMNHRLSFSCHLLGAFSRVPYILPDAGIAPNDMGYAWDPSPFAARFWYCIQHMHYSATIIFRPYVYCLVLLAIGGVSFWMIRKRRNEIAVPAAALCVSGFAYLGTFMLLAVSTDFRYTTWTIFCSVMSLLLLPAVIREPQRVAGPQNP